MRKREAEITFGQDTKDHWIGVMKKRRVPHKHCWVIRETPIPCTPNPLDKNFYKHDIVFLEAGLPFWVTHLAEEIQKMTPYNLVKKFTIDFIEAMPVDRDITEILYKLSVKRLSWLKKETKGIDHIIDQVIHCHMNWRDGIRLGGLEEEVWFCNATQGDQKINLQNACFAVEDSNLNSSCEDCYADTVHGFADLLRWDNKAYYAFWKRERMNLLKELRALD